MQSWNCYGITLSYLSSNTPWLENYFELHTVYFCFLAASTFIFFSIGVVLYGAIVICMPTWLSEWMTLQFSAWKHLLSLLLYQTWQRIVCPEYSKAQWFEKLPDLWNIMLELKIYLIKSQVKNTQFKSISTICIWKPLGWIHSG